jgi:hypothetical protein
LNIKSWQQNSAASFYSWLEDVKPKILHRNGQYKEFKPTEDQKKLIEDVLSSTNDFFRYSMSLLIQPRRHGKSTVFCLIILWLFTSRKNFTVCLLGNSEMHSRRTQFNMIRNIITNTPLLKSSIPESKIRQYDILFPQLGNAIQLGAFNISSSFGDRINLLWVSDLHAASDLGPFNALQSSLLDSEDSICLIDSNVDHTDGPVHSLQKEAESDTTIFCRHRQYKDIEDYEARAPEWIDRQKARRLQRTTLPTDFARDILGKRLDAQNALFPSNVIELSKSSYKIPVADIQSLAKGRSYKIGGGLDRSKSLFAGKHGDHTVWTVIMKVASPETGEPEYYILNQQKIVPNTSRSIKKAILKDHERFKLDNCVLENYEVADLAPWLTDQRIPYELVSAHDTNQNASFPEFYRIASEGRFNFSSDLKDLESEMRTFSYTQRAGGKYSFGHSSKKYKDDTVYSTNWAIFSLRSAVMTLYSLGNIQCNLKSTAKRRHCYIFGGRSVLFCSKRCDAHFRIEEMFQNYKQYQFDSELTLQEFLQYKVKRIGARISQSA